MRRLNYLLPLMLAAALAGTSLSQAETPTDALVIGITMEAVTSLDPAEANSLEATEIVANLYDRLVVIAPGATEVAPSVAESWSYDESTNTFTFVIKEGLTFASGNPVSAEDAAWSLRRVLTLDFGNAADFKQWGFSPENAAELIRAEGGNLLITMPRPVAPELFLYTVAGGTGSVIDSKVVLEHEAEADLGHTWLLSNAAGSGPYVLSEWQPNNVLLATARADYPGGAPAMSRVFVRHVPESTTQRLQIEAGDLDVAKRLTVSDLSALEGHPSIGVASVEGLGFYYVALDQANPILSNPKVREAFRHLLDWEQLSDSVMKYYGFPHQNIITRGQLGSSDALPYAYDPAKAKALIAEAGYPDGFSATIYPSSGASPQLELVESLQASGAEAGLDLAIEIGSNVARFRDRNFDIYLGRSGGRLPDPVSNLQVFASNPDNEDTSNSGLLAWRASWVIPELTTLAEQASLPLPEAEREALIVNARTLYDASYPPIIPFFQRIDPFAYRTVVEGYVGDPIWLTRWDTVTKQ